MFSLDNYSIVSSKKGQKCVYTEKLESHTVVSVSTSWVGKPEALNAFLRYVRKNFCIGARSCAVLEWGVKIQYKLIKIKPMRNQRTRKIFGSSHCILLNYWSGFFHAFASPSWGWVGGALAHGASSNWTQALIDDSRSALGHTWFPSTVESSFGLSPELSGSVCKRSWNSPSTLWFSSEEVSEEEKHFSRGSSVLPKIDTKEKDC